jgi:hypothetical protein
MRILSSLFRALYYGHLVLALGLLSITYLTYAELSKPFDWTYLAFVFCGVLLVYNVHAWVQFKTASPESIATKPSFQWQKENQWLSLGIALFGLVGIGFYAMRLSEVQMKGMAVLVAPVLLYVLPVNGIGKWLSPRIVPFFKPLLLAFCCMWVTAIIPMAEVQFTGTELFWWTFSATKYAVVRYVFFLLPAIISDLPDKELDASYGIKTFANSFSLLAFRYVGTGFAVLHIALMYGFMFQSSIILNWFVADLLLLGMLIDARIHVKDAYYSFGLDLALLIPFLSWYFLGL